MDEYPIKVADFDKNIWRRIILIYRGIASHVYKIQNTNNGTYAVLKTYSKSEYTGTAFKRHNRYFYTEVECNKIMIRTKYAVPLWYYYESEKEWGMITKYMSQLTLRNYIHLFPFSDVIISKVVFPLLTAIYHMHQKGIIHRDLKPDNIFVNNDKIYIGDFGYSYILKNPSDKAYGIVGTVQYMAPEILDAYVNDTRHYMYGKEVDIWAIGIIVYEMFFYEKPFGWNKYTKNEDDLKDFVTNDVTRELTFPSAIPDDAKDFIRTCLSIDPEKRPTIEVLLEHKWILNYLNKKNDINEKCPQWSFSILALTAQVQEKNLMTRKKNLRHQCMIF
jgi:serine/threonine protein kinase